MKTFARILVPIDPTPLANDAMDVALSLAEKSGAQVWIVFARPDPTPMAETMRQINADLTEVDRGNAYLAAAADRAVQTHDIPRDRVHTQLRAGPPHKVILEAAEELDIDLVVMGSHGRHGVVDAITGSTAERVVAHARASVFVLHSDTYFAEGTDPDPS